MSNDIDKEIGMKKKITIEGMMCGGCAKSVKEALEAVEEVKEAVVSHEEGTAIVELAGDVSDDTLETAVEDKDFVVTSIDDIQ